MEKIKDITSKIEKLIKEGELEKGGKIRLTHLNENEKILVRACYAGRRDIKCEEIYIIDATKPNEDIYSLEITYLKRNKNA